MGEHVYYLYKTYVFVFNMKKLTLSAEEGVIDQARRIADREHTSISAIFSNFIRNFARQKKSPLEIPTDSIAARAAGVISMPRAKSSGDVLADALIEKYRGGK